MIKILALSDIYGEIEVIEELIDIIEEKFNICVIAGGINKPKEDVSREIFEELLKISEKILFVNGGTDKVEFHEDKNIWNLEIEPFVLNKDGIKIGFFGIGGVPNRSIKRKKEYLNIWNEGFKDVERELLKKLEVNYEKVQLNKPDFSFFISHSPPYGIADYSKKITLNEFEVLQDIEEYDIEEKKTTSNPIHLGSKILKEFIFKKKINVHLFGHVHKEGGKIIRIENTLFINVAHLSTIPYKLTGRKYCTICINQKNLNIEFKSVVNPDLNLEDFLEIYI